LLRRRLAFVVALATLASACGSCGKTQPGGGAASASGEGSAAPGVRTSRDATPERDAMLWENAKSGDPEDLASLATREGAVGLVEAAEDPALRPRALRAMAYAPGWAQLPYLAKTASGQDDASARLALDSVVELASRPRRVEDPEDKEELESGCTQLAALAKDATAARARRVPAIRALRMMPCPKIDLPTDVDVK
jgi:hypothetical protein